MAVTLEKFIEYLDEIGFMTADEVYDFIDGLPLSKQPTSARRLVQEMFNREKLTKFQTDLIFKGKARRLVLGNYVILERLGRGGMGRVFKARHRRMERLVALKVLPWKARGSPETVRRFHREVRAAARLSHPNIVTAHDADEARGVHFLVMEYVHGSDLLARVNEQGPLAVDTAIDYILQAARGLEYAHSVKVIHLDIKPANLLLDEHGTVKILDMGLARIDDVVSEGGSATAEALIQSGKVMGTVDYVSPERADDPEAVDGRADIYSLGCTLFFLLTARPPYRGDTLKKRIFAHRTQPIPFLRAIRPDVPEALDAVFRRMVAKDPRDRQRTMTEVIADLNASRGQADQTAPPLGAGLVTSPEEGEECGRETSLSPDPEKQVAARVLEIGGALEVSVNGKYKGVQELSELPREEVQVTFIDLAHNRRVTGELLERVQRLTGLRELDLFDSSVTDQGLRHLESLTSLQVLRLAQTQVSDAALGHLKKLCRLIKLDLQDTRVTAPGVYALQMALPDCEVVANPDLEDKLE